MERVSGRRSVAVGDFEKTVDVVDTRAIASYFIETLFAVGQLLPVDVDDGSHCCIYGGQYDIGRVFASSYHGSGRGYDVGVELVDAYIALVDVF